MGEFIFRSFVREMTGVHNLIIAYEISDLEEIGQKKLVDVIVLNAMVIGFNMNNELEEIKLHFPEAFMVCVCPYQLESFICWKFIQHGVDALVANIETAVEFDRLCVAIKNRTRYYPPAYRRAFEDVRHYSERSFRFLTRKEYNILALTLDGLTLKEIAERMGVAETTICTLRKRAFIKTGSKSLVDFVKVGAQYNLNFIEGEFCDLQV